MIYLFVFNYFCFRVHYLLTSALGYGFTAYILTCLKTRKKDLRTFGKPLVVRYDRAGLMAPLQRGRPHAYFTYAM